MAVIQFQKLWDSHPYNQNPQIENPCLQPDGTKSFINQCAIRLGIALAGAGMNTRAFGGERCWFQGHTNHILRAEELANWLARPAQLGAPTRYTRGRLGEAEFGQTVLDAVSGKKGIVFCKDFYEGGGDHIDAWDGSQMAKGQVGWYGRSVQVRFWEITT